MIFIAIDALRSMWNDAKAVTLQLWLRRPLRSSDPPIEFSRSNIGFKTMFQFVFVICLIIGWIVVMVFFLWPFFLFATLIAGYSLLKTLSVKNGDQQRKG